ncbi:hypothetical protein GCM10009713_11410 [Brevibacterium celere]|nr:FAD-dependent oxidoreductase [Brevibacterium sp. XM4083]
MSSATRLRRLDESAKIVVFERVNYVSFANCGLPYYVGGVIKDRNAVLVQTPEALRSRFELDIRTGQDVIAIDPASRTVTVRDVRALTETTESYDYLVLAAGSVPRDVFAGAADGPAVATLRSIDDVGRITARLESVGDGVRAVVAGGGFIGLEAVENLAHRGAEVTLVQHSPYPLSPLNPEMAATVLDELATNGVTVHVNSSITELTPEGVLLDDGTAIACELVDRCTRSVPGIVHRGPGGVARRPDGRRRRRWVAAHQRLTDPRCRR